jgi:CRP-like cAMP-binding protein
MYFIATGSAFVKRSDRSGVERFLGKLEEGSHFGDIAMFYQTKRTATVISGDFSTLAKLSVENYKDLVKKMPEFQSMVEKCVQGYNDESKKHMYAMLKKIEFLKEGVPDVILNKLVYTTPAVQYDPGTMIFKPGTEMNTI